MTTDDRPLSLYWVNQYAATPDQPGGTRHYDMASELRRLGLHAIIVASDLSHTTRTYSRRRGPLHVRPIHDCVGDVELVWLSAGSYRHNDWRRVVSMLVFGVGVTTFLSTVRRGGRRLVFIGSSPHLFAAFGSWLAAALRRVPFVFEVRDLWPESYVEVSRREDALSVSVMRWMADVLYRRARAIVVLAEPNRERIAARGVDPRKIHYIPNGVDLSAFAEVPAAPRDCLPVVFVYAGAHGPANGLETVVHACVELHRRGRDDVRVVLVGDGPAKDELRGQVQSLGLRNIELRDPVPKDQVPALLASFDVGLMVLAPAPLFSYGVSPNKLFDYLGANLPVLANVPGVVTNIVAEAGAGRACPPGDPIALAEAMVQMAAEVRADPRRYRTGRVFVAQHFERRVHAKRLAAVIQAVSDGRPIESLERAGDRVSRNVL